jgi:predicted dehydrogenase
MSQNKLGVGIVGCGDIAVQYVKWLKSAPEVDLVGITDIDRAKAEALGAAQHCRVYAQLEDLLAEARVQVAVNLTTHHAHRAVTETCLNAGKHVYSEKPLALTFAEAQALVALAAQKGLRLACSPFTLMGEAAQTAWAQLRANRVGQVRLAYAEVNHGRIETWHPAPIPFYQVGAMWDVGVYPLAILTAMLGPARRVTAFGKLLKPDRVTKDGVPYTVSTPDWIIALIETESGALIRLTTTFYANNRSKQTGIEFHGDLGSLFLAHWFLFDAPVEVAAYGEPYQTIPPVRQGPPSVPWSTGVQELVQAILEERPHRCSAEHAAHVVEILEAVTCSYTENRPVAITSSFTPPAPMEWAVV